MLRRQEAVNRHRLNLYREQTQAVVDQYARRAILTKVHGAGSVSEVTERALDSLDRWWEPPAMNPYADHCDMGHRRVPRRPRV